MDFVRLLPVILSALLMAAHFSRADNIALAVFSIAAPLLLFVRKPLIVRGIRVALVVGALEWLRTLLSMAARRQDMGQPWVRMAVILGAVAAFTALSALVFSSKGLKERCSL